MAERKNGRVGDYEIGRMRTPFLPFSHSPIPPLSHSSILPFFPNED
jgi:hypothetical protein